MNILILNPIGRLSNGKYVCLFPSRWDAATAWKNPPYYPYELAYLSALLKRDYRHGEIRMFDPNMYDLTWEQTVRVITDDYGPDIVITECSALTYPDMTKVIQALKEKDEIDIAWLCGPYGTHNSAKARADGWDEVFHGEYEADVLTLLKGGRNFEDLGAGEVLNHAGDSAVDPAWSRQKKLIDLDWLPWPEDDDIRRINYGEWSNPYKSNLSNHTGMVQLYATRGCPLSCTFCVVPTYYGGHQNSFRSHRVRNCGDVCDEIEYLARKYEGQFLGCFFNEETHNANPTWLESFATRLLERGLNRYHYDAMCGYWAFSEDLIKLLAKAGYCQIRIGIESTSEAVGKKIGKRIIPEKLWKVLEWCKTAGIWVYGTTQVGAPGSTFESDRDTLETMLRLRADGYIRTWQNSVSTPQPGTPMYTQAKAEGRLLTEDISEYDGTHPVMELPGYPAEKIMEAKRMFGA